MGKKGRWFSAIKSLCSSSSKEGEKKRWKEKKGNRGGRLRTGSFFKEPSSVEDILREIDQHTPNTFPISHHPQSQPPQPPQPQPPSLPPPPPPPPQSQCFSPSRPHNPISPPNQHPKGSYRPEPALQQCHLSATRIQAVYRGYIARRKVRGLVRLQRVVTSQNVKRQTVNALKQMQTLVRVLTQIHSQRICMLKNQPLKSQPNSSNLHKQSEEWWDDSLITKEEQEARMQRKMDAVIKRKRAMAYAYSHQVSKGKATSAYQTSSIGGYPYPYPWWWNWLEHQLSHHTTPLRHHFADGSTPPCTNKQPTTPMSSKSMTPTNRKTYPTKDDDSLMSCPPFSVPSYMSPTVSARARSKASESSKRRFSVRFTPNASNNHKSPASIGNLSVDSANSMPASVGRRSFYRFV